MSHTSASLVEESNRLFHHTWTYFARQMPGGGTTRLPGLLLANGRSALPFMNVAFVTAPLTDDADLRARIDRAGAHFRSDGVPWLLIVAADAVPEALRATLTSLCTDAGLEYLMPMFGMATDDLVDPVRPAPALDLQIVTTDAHRVAVGDLNAEGYGMPAELFGPVTGQPDLWKDMVGIIGRVDGEPVSTASVALIDDVAYVALVATSPEHQHKGYAEAVMRRTLLEAREAWGVQRTVLHATPAGQPVYRRMGYVDTLRFDAFAGH